MYCRRGRGSDDGWAIQRQIVDDEVPCSAVVVPVLAPLGRLVEDDIAADDNSIRRRVIESVSHGPGLVVDENCAAAAVVKLPWMWCRHLDMCDAAKRSEMVDV
jgi:hypothetical protein